MRQPVAGISLSWARQGDNMDGHEISFPRRIKWIETFFVRLGEDE